MLGYPCDNYMIDYQDLSGISYEEPQKYTIDNIAFHEPTSRLIKNEKRGKTMLFKAKIFLEKSCVIQISSTEWNCLPIQDYNKRTYLVRLTSEGFVCGCQGFNEKVDKYESGKSEVVPICSHVLAVKQFCFIQEKNKGKGR